MEEGDPRETPIGEPWSLSQWSLHVSSSLPRKTSQSRHALCWRKMSSLRFPLRMKNISGEGGR